MMTKYNTATLGCGLRVIHLPSAAPVVYCGIGIPAGSRHEKADEEGVAHFCEHVTFKGTQRPPYIRGSRIAFSRMSDGAWKTQWEWVL